MKRASGKISTKYIFVVGGVMSGVGKGIAASSIGAILQAKGFEVTALKIDPYVNVDAGTMNPTEHGEVFVLDDGTECDQDLGNYERFLNRSLSRENYMTTGSVYLSVIERERRMGYRGKCVSVVPDVPREVIAKIQRATRICPQRDSVAGGFAPHRGRARLRRAEIVTIEIGGTVGEYQNILFLEAVRMLRLAHPHDVLLALVSYLPLQGRESEPKTKPTQYAVRTLNAAGLQPDIVIARAAVPLDRKRKEKIAWNCNMRGSDVISAPDVKNIYEIPLNFERDNLSEVLLQKWGIKARQRDLKAWRRLQQKMRWLRKKVRIGIVGKYFKTGGFILADSYISVIEAIKHASYAEGAAPEIHWLSSEVYERDPAKLRELAQYDGIIVPGGFGSRGTEGKIAAIRWCRMRKKPFLGLCYGMQLAVVEFARAAGFKGAHTTEVDAKTPHPVIDVLPEQKKNLADKNYGGTMRRGAYPAQLVKGSIAREAYGKRIISERHRHRYEVNPAYAARLEKKGLVFSGRSPDRRLMEIAELPWRVHPFFLGTQFHPEFLSRPLAPHPLFRAFLRAALRKK